MGVKLRLLDIDYLIDGLGDKSTLLDISTSDRLRDKPSLLDIDYLIGRKRDKPSFLDIDYLVKRR